MITRYGILIFLALSNLAISAQSIHPKNIILLIGDGMGLAHIQTAYEQNGHYLHMLTLPVSGLQMTASSSDRITDSGASGTAMATGVKTYNGAIAVDTNKLPIPTILELAEAEGMLTGLIATSSVTHATPASFAAHRESRVDHEGIALDISSSGVDYIGAGGYKYFISRGDGQNLIDTMKKIGYMVLAPDMSLTAEFIKTPLAHFYADEHMPSMPERGSILTEAMQEAFLCLGGQDQGFFLMVEGSQIDWAAHKNSAGGVVTELLDFDAAVDAALSFARQDSNTLVIVTADHETGGMTLNEGLISAELKPRFSTLHHTAVMVPVFAYGPGAELFTGVYENTGIFERMAAALSLKSE